MKIIAETNARCMKNYLLDSYYYIVINFWHFVGNISS